MSRYSPIRFKYKSEAITTTSVTRKNNAEHGFILVPGAGGVAWYWHQVVELLQNAGREAVAVDLPGDDPQASLPEYTRLIVEAAGGQSDLVLVAHSLGGFTVPLVAVPLAAIVFVNAMIPTPGETAAAWWQNTGQSQAQTGAAKNGGYGVDFDLKTYLLHDVSDDIVAAGSSHQRSEADAVFGKRCDFAEWPDIPIRVVIGAEDRFFPIDIQRRVARERLRIEADILPGGHLIALSQPKPLAQYLLAI